MARHDSLTIYKMGGFNGTITPMKKKKYKLSGSCHAERERGISETSN